jgi:hypothetical protein
VVEDLRKIFATFTMALLLSSFMYCSQASMQDPKLSVSTGEVALAFGIKVKIVYEAYATVSKPSSAQPGETKSLNVALNGGTLSVSVYVPSPINNWYSASQSVPIGSFVDIPVATGVSARVKVISSAQLSVSGPANLDVYSLTWESEGTRSVSVNILPDAKAGQTVTIKMNFQFPIYVGVVVDLLLFQKEIASTNIGAFSASPTLSESINIGTSPLQSPISISWYIIIAAVVLLIIAVSGYAAYRHHKTSTSKYSTNITRYKCEDACDILMRYFLNGLDFYAKNLCYGLC